MNLDARSESCFSSTYVLKLDGRSFGEFKRRWFSEELEVRAMGRKSYRFQKRGWPRSCFKLLENGTGKVLGEAEREGFLTSAWSLTLSTGPARLVSAGFFNTAYVVQQRGKELGRVNRLGLCERGWVSGGIQALSESDLLLVGLVYHTIQRRNAAASSAAASSGS